MLEIQEELWLSSQEVTSWSHKPLVETRNQASTTKLRELSTVVEESILSEIQIRTLLAHLEYGLSTRISQV